MDAVIAALKASGPSEQPRAAGGRSEIIRTFAEKVHGAEDSCNPAPDATAQSIIFDGKQLPDPNCAQVIVSQEAPGRFALFVLMGGADFTQDREEMCR